MNPPEGFIPEPPWVWRGPGCKYWVWGGKKSFGFPGPQLESSRQSPDLPAPPALSVGISGSAWVFLRPGKRPDSMRLKACQPLGTTGRLVSGSAAECGIPAGELGTARRQGRDWGVWSLGTHPGPDHRGPPLAFPFGELNSSVPLSCI